MTESPDKPKSDTQTPAKSSQEPAKTESLPAERPASEAAKPSGEPNASAANMDRGTNLSATSSKSAEAEPARPVSKQVSLQMQINMLEKLQSRLKALRTLPAHLLVFHSQSPLLPLSELSGLGIGLDSTSGPDGGLNTGADSIASLLTESQGYPGQAYNAFRKFKEVSDDLRKDDTQNALKLARESEAQDRSEISLAGRRDRKRR